MKLTKVDVTRPEPSVEHPPRELTVNVTLNNCVILIREVHNTSNPVTEEFDVTEKYEDQR